MSHLTHSGGYLLLRNYLKSKMRADSLPLLTQKHLETKKEQR